MPIERGKGIDQPLMDDVIRKLDEGDWVHMFPEGTRSRDGKLGRVRLGVSKCVSLGCLVAWLLGGLVAWLLGRVVRVNLPRIRTSDAPSSCLHVLHCRWLVLCDALSQLTTTTTHTRAHTQADC